MENFNRNLKYIIEKKTNVVEKNALVLFKKS